MRIRAFLWPALALLLGLAAPASATTFTVTVTDDSNDGVCDAHCSLREALAAAQSATGAPHTIAFNIPGGGVKTITCLQASNVWPFITQAVTIDGYTQPGSAANTNATGAINAVPLIVLRTDGLGTGLQVLGPVPVVIRGLVMNSFTSSQIAQFDGTVTVLGSFIGTNADGLSAPAGNVGHGILSVNGTLHVGGLAPADRNLISGLQAGVLATANFSLITVSMQGNLVGTNKTGTAAIANVEGFRSTGGGNGTATAQIGGATAAARNVFSGNTVVGIDIGNGGVGNVSFATNSFAKGNLVGTDVTGTSPLPNGTGIQVHNGPNVVVGGLAAGEANVVAFNTSTGVSVQSGSVNGLSVLSNSIHSNGGLGIDLDCCGVTPNDAGDADTNRTNFPVVTAITRNAGTTVVQGTFDAPITGTYRLQVFTNTLPNASSHGEGQTLVAQSTPAVGATGVQTFSVTVPQAIPAADFIALTLTDPGNNTSEFSEFVADLVLTEVDTPDPAFTGQQVTTTFTIANRATSLFPSAPVAVVYNLNNTSTFVSATGGATPAAGVITLPVGALVPGQSAQRSVVVTYAAQGFKQSQAHLTTRVTDPVPADNTLFMDTTVNQAALTFTISGQVRDLNDTGVPGVTMTLSGSQAGTRTTDADGNYVFAALPQAGTYTVTPSATSFTFNPPAQTFPNLQADQVAGFFVAQAGNYTRYFAEGATGSFFDTFIALLNATGQPATATVKFQKENGQVISKSVQLAGLARATIVPETLAGLENASFSTVVESTQPIIADRTMRWDSSGYGSHAETSVAAPLTTWYLAEGATTGGFNLFYLLQNPTAQAATVEIQYLRPAPAAPIVKTYTVTANTRRTIYVNGEDAALDEAEISAVITSTNAVPIVVERAMYLDVSGQLFGAGHESAAVPELSTSWFFAEGATGPFFNMFILVANPGDQDATIEARYLLPNGQVVSKTHTSRAHSRLTIGVHGEDPALLTTSVSTTLRSTNAVPFLAERSMWWPALPANPQWQEGHNSAGAVRTGEKWGMAEGEEGGPFSQQTFVLVANTSDSAGSVQVTVVFEDGTTAQLAAPIALAAHSRTTLPMGTIFPAVRGRRFGTIVESLGPNAVQIVVERAIYNDAVINGQNVVWAAGSNAMGTRLR
jgi:CSLREA domain-containing protein